MWGPGHLSKNFSLSGFALTGSWNKELAHNKTNQMCPHFYFSQIASNVRVVPFSFRILRWCKFILSKILCLSCRSLLENLILLLLRTFCTSTWRVLITASWVNRCCQEKLYSSVSKVHTYRVIFFISLFIQQLPYNRWGWIGLKLGAENSWEVFHKGGRDPVEASLSCQRLELGAKSEFQSQGCGVPSVLPTRQKKKKKKIDSLRM